MVSYEGTYWAEWWHRAVWPQELQLWGHLKRAGPQDCMTACFHDCHKHTRAQSMYWYCSEWGSRCQRSRQGGSTCSSPAGWIPPFSSGYWQCCLWKDADGQSLLAKWFHMRKPSSLFLLLYSTVTDAMKTKKWKLNLTVLVANGLATVTQIKPAWSQHVY